MAHWLIEDTLGTVHRDEERARKHPPWFLALETLRVAGIVALLLTGLDAFSINVELVDPSRRFWAVVAFATLLSLFGLARLRLLPSRRGI